MGKALKKSFVNEAFILMAGMLWGIIGIFTRSLADSEVNTMLQVCMRTFFTALCVGVFILFKDKSLFRIKLKHIPIFLGMGILSFLVCNFTYMISITENSLLVASLFLNTAPIFVTFLSAIFFKEKITVIKISALVIAVGGCALVTLTNDVTCTPFGFLIGICSGLGYAGYTMFGKVASNHYSAVTMLFYTFLFAGFGALPISRFWELNLSAVTMTDFSLIFVMAIVTVLIPYALYNTGLKTVPAGKASILALTDPVVATVCGIFYGEGIKIAGVIGITMVICAIILLNKNTVKQ